jgi:acyl carrier protein
MRDEILDLVSGAIAVPRDTLHAGTRLDAIIRDSIDAVELVALLDERFGIDIDPADLAGIATLGDVDAFVTRHEDTPRRGRPAF